MIKEVRKLAKTNRAKANYIRSLQNRGLIKTELSPKGYVCYDTDELKKYKESVKMGRPSKAQK